MTTWHHLRVYSRDVDLDLQLLVFRTLGLPSPVAGGDIPPLLGVVCRVFELGQDAVVVVRVTTTIVVVVEDAVELQLLRRRMNLLTVNSLHSHCRIRAHSSNTFFADRHRVCNESEVR